MTYKIEKKDERYNLYSSKINLYVIENASLEDIKITLAIEKEYQVKLEIVELLMTFPHGFSTMDDKIIQRPDAVKEYQDWCHQTQQRIGFLDQYYSLIDQKIKSLLT